MAAGAGANVDLLSSIEVSGSSTLGVTVMRTIIHMVATTAIALGDDLAVGLIVMRSAEIGAAVVGATTPATFELPWAYLDHFYGTAGTDDNSLESDMRIDVRSRRKVQYISTTYALSMLNQAGVAKTLKIFGRTLVALP
jgi:hypothetical protein